MSVDQERGLPILSQTESANCRTSASTREGLRPIIEDRPEPDTWTILASGLILFLAFAELGLAFIQKKYPPWNTAFVTYVLHPV